MTHTPPVPAGNQSPYPLQEAPHVRPETRPPAVVANDDDDRDTSRSLADLPLTTIGAVVGIGAALIGGLWLGLRATSAKAKPKRRTRPARR